jgi:hypothetical protein
MTDKYKGGSQKIEVEAGLELADLNHGKLVSHFILVWVRESFEVILLKLTG